MYKRLIATLVMLIVIVTVQAQTVTVTGKIVDADTKEALSRATVKLTRLQDTLAVQSALTNNAGEFVFTARANDSVVISLTSIGYENFFKTLYVNNTNNRLGTIQLHKASEVLSEVTINATPSLAQQKGDTLQFNASQFKVNPDASAEDLARKVPGLTVENGQVKAQGENVRRVTLDGRELFGDDATAALRNLPAEIVDKIQVFDRLTDQAEASGINNGETQKEINIITKANMRNGQFGRVYGGYGTDNRYQVGGNTTLLHENRRISIVGNFNNVNQQNFSSQDLLGVTSSGGGRGGFRGGRGGGFGGNNFQVGQQNGINRTNAFGINYSDILSPKLKISGSYFINNSQNITNEQVNRQFFSKTSANLTQANTSNTNNTNHRFNLRLEYQIDSFNRIIFTPNIGIQSNNSTRVTNTKTFFSPTDLISEINNATNSQRNGNNFSNNLLYSHSFRKRGRNFSINLNTSYNDRNGESYIDLLTRKYNNGVPSDSSELRFTDQFNNGLNVSANLSYVEPISKNAQIQFTYNPSYSKNKADQAVYNYNDATSKYSVFSDSLSNLFNNITKAQNAGISYRYGTRDNNVNFGVNLQQTELNSDRVFPRPLTVDKTFTNFLPNAMMRLKLSAKSNLRVFYRTQTNQPSVTQLQDVIDPNNSPFYSVGNPDLKQQYNHTLSTNYTFTNTAKGLLVVGNVFAQKTDNYIANATYLINRDSLVKGIIIPKGSQLTAPINLNGYVNLRSFVTFAMPLKFIKTNLNLNGGVGYVKQPGFFNNEASESETYTYSMGMVLASNISQYIDFTVSYSPNFNKVNNTSNTRLAAANTNYFQHNAGLQLNLLSKKGWFFQNDITNIMYNGLSQGFNQNYVLWNMSAGKKLFKSQKAEIKFGVFDLLKQNQSISRNVTQAYIEDESNQVLTQYFMLTFTYNLRNFGKGSKTSSQPEENNFYNRGFMPGQGGGQRPPRPQ